ncbi:protein trichome birefringence-like 34 [Actinidia eriantha]|uniref:protein trichome birefringence-like 34 n=1 Tax=Actinidia eriantha TaxID=165200 RepID=UPI00258CECC0|nr:protein trichome birefringence-like 34 [Actinidia eriantha]
MAKTDQEPVLGLWGIGWCFQSLTAVFIGFLIISAVYLTGERRPALLEDETTRNNSLLGCNLFSGKWVSDNKSCPLYKERQCSFMLDDFACEKFGRRDLKYQHWRWQPHDCDLPRFNATVLLEKLRGKRLVFVGDSLNRNQWVSLVCLVESSIPPGLKFRHLNGSLYTFKAIEYNASIDFYWAPFLVESNCDDPIYHHVQYRTVKIQAIEKHARHWNDADFLIFDSYIWWLEDTMKVLWGLSEEPSGGLFKEVELLSRYEMGLKTWADWLETHVNHTKTKLFFVSMSSTHLRGEEWGMGANQNCYNETEPIFEDGYWGTLSNPKMMQVVEETIDRLEMRGVKVHILNITQLSEYRKDGHPSIYRRQWVALTEEQLANPPSFSDCGHWCLPGVPDTWNELLYAYMFYY